MNANDVNMRNVLQCQLLWGLVAVLQLDAGASPILLT